MECLWITPIYRKFLSVSMLPVISEYEKEEKISPAMDLAEFQSFD